MLTVGDLFSGIGGFSLGLERAGMRTAWFAEVDPYASAVLKKHWPEVPNHGDVRSIRAGNVERVDVLCGGFPCQPFSSAARGANTMDAYLWPEMCRVVRELQPSWVCGENVVAIDGVVLESVAADLENLGYEVQLLVIPACAVGHDHRRDRYWILGHANGHSQSRRAVNAEAPRVPQRRADNAGVVGASDGLSHRVDRLRCLGNAIVPQIAEIIGRAIVRAQ